MKHKNTIKKAINFLHSEGDLFECCSIGEAGIRSGYFDDPIKAAAECVKEDEKHKPEGIFITVNPCNENLCDESYGKFRKSEERTKDSDITKLSNLPFDIDPVRPSGVCATKKEQKRARKMAKKVEAYLKENGFPDPMNISSGNGAQLIYKADLENTEENTNLIRDLLKALDQKFSTSKVKIDTSVYNPSRLVRLPGTVNRKGKNLPNRPHRRAKIIQIPENPSAISVKQLKTVASIVTTENKKSSGKSALMDVPAYLKYYGIKVKKVKKYRGGNLYILDECLFNEKHKPGKAAIFQSSEGTLYYQCFHNSCREKKWQDARYKISGTDELGKFNKNRSSRLSNDETPYSIMTGSELLEKRIKEKPLIKGLLEKRGSLLIIGQTGIKKSMLTLHMALTLATRHKDNRLWGVFELPPKPIRTLFIQSENGISGTQNRMKLMIHSNPELKAGTSRLSFPVFRKDFRITGDLRTENFREKIKDMIFKTRARLIVVDPLISFNGAGENDNTEVRKVLDALTEICDIAKVACIVVHHMGKSSSNDVFSGRGASAIADWANDILIMIKADKDGQKLIKIKHEKSRNFIPALPFILEAPDTLTFKRIESHPTEKGYKIAVETLKELGGDIEDQGTFKKELVKREVGSPATAGRLIEKAVKAGEIEEVPDGKKLGYRLVEIDRD